MGLIKLLKRVKFVAGSGNNQQRTSSGMGKNWPEAGAREYEDIDHTRN
jgi:hypothetical protein